jgi:hypothetical protein
MVFATGPAARGSVRLGVEGVLAVTEKHVCREALVASGPEQ